MLWRRKKRFNPEIEPEEIFLDASNTPAFDHARFEGKIEKPLGQGVFISLAVVFTILFAVLVVRAWNLQITNGSTFATESAHNSLEVRTLFAPRGIITDRNGTVVAENAEGDDGSMVRRYPYPSLSQIIGYVSYPKKDAHGVYYDTSETGVAGLEAEYDTLLTGKNGQVLTETDALGRVRSEGMTVPPVGGGTLKLSLDANLQRLFYQAIAHTASSARFIAGAGVILDIHTGEVHSIASYPSYDPNVMSSGGPASVIDSYNANPGRPFLDHAIQGVYAPGSIVKPIVSAGALSDGIITQNTVIDDPGFLSIPDPYHPGKTFIYKGWKALGAVDVRKAIAWSSDVFFYTVGGGFGPIKGLGIDRLKYWYNQFGLGNSTNINLYGEAKGLIPSPVWKKETFDEPWYLGDTYFTAIGQYSVQVTPIQMAVAIAAVANGGKLVTPTLLAGAEPRFTTIPVDTHALAVVREGMRQSVTSALASAINVPYIKVAAKTGTAQTGTRNQYDNSWLVGFFPYDNPRYAFSIVLERGPEGAGEQAVNVMRLLLDSLYAEQSSYIGG